MSRLSDLGGVVRGLTKIGQAVLDHQQKELSRIWANSSLTGSIQPACENVTSQMEDCFSQNMVNPENIKDNVSGVMGQDIGGVMEKAQQATSAVMGQAEQVASTAFGYNMNSSQAFDNINAAKDGIVNTSKVTFDVIINKDIPETDTHDDDSHCSVHSAYGSNTETAEDDDPVSPKPSLGGISSPYRQYHTASIFRDPNVLANLSKVRRHFHTDTAYFKEDVTPSSCLPKKTKKFRPKPLQERKDWKGKINEKSREQKVPGSRIARIMSFGQLAFGLAGGVIGETTKRGLGLKEIKRDKTGNILDQNPVLSEANAERIVKTLCKVRGAALKIGQMLSIQDAALISPELTAIFERVRHHADFMPKWQMDQMMTRELGENWQSKLASFDERPFAAASIGQVHRATLHDGREVAIKIQYPGVAESIDSDLDNLMSMLKVAKVLPEGMFAEDMLDYARKELRWECDYLRESRNQKTFADFMGEDDILYVPEVIPELCTKAVLTTELVQGQSVDKMKHLPQETQNLICESILNLCLRELFVYGFMQTDPNWSNFLYDENTGRISLLDFGASRQFDKNFIESYIQLIYCGAIGDPQGVADWSVKLGFLTGYEAKIMVDAHVDSVMILGEAFREDKPFDFGAADTSSRIHGLIPTMLKHRLTAPPEETYALHRKMGGCYLLCTKLNAKINCKPMWDELLAQYRDQTGASVDFATTHKQVERAFNFA